MKWWRGRPRRRRTDDDAKFTTEQTAGLAQEAREREPLKQQQEQMLEVYLSQVDPELAHKLRAIYAQRKITW